MSVSPSDVAVALGRPITDADETAQIWWWIQSAELKIRNRLGDLGALDQENLTYVLVEAVAAKAENPRGAESETVDDYTYRMPPDSRKVTITDEWWDMLAPDSVPTRAAYSVSLAGPEVWQ